MKMKIIGPRVKSQSKKYVIVYSCWCTFTWVKWNKCVTKIRVQLCLYCCDKEDFNLTVPISIKKVYHTEKSVRLEFLTCVKMENELT